MAAAAAAAWWQRGISGGSSTAGRVVAGSSGSLAVAARRWRRWQRDGGRGSSAAARQRQLGGGGGSVAAEAAVGDSPLMLSRLRCGCLALSPRRIKTPTMLQISLGSINRGIERVEGGGRWARQDDVSSVLVFVNGEGQCQLSGHLHCRPPLNSGMLLRILVLLISSMVDGWMWSFYVFAIFLHLFVSPGQPCQGVHQDSPICDKNHKL